MTETTIHGIKLTSDSADTITFHEGLIGLTHIRHVALVREHQFDPLIWMISADDPDFAIVLVDPKEFFPDYSPSVTEELRARIGLGHGETPLILSIATVNSDPDKCAFNLRAPVFINTRKMLGAQAALVGSSYKLAEPLPTGVTAELSISSDD